MLLKKTEDLELEIREIVFKEVQRTKTGSWFSQLPVSVEKVQHMQGFFDRLSR